MDNTQILKFTQSNDKEIMTKKEIANQLNVPLRDNKLYPMPTKEEKLEAGDFIFKLNLLASTADENLQALVWRFYMKLDDFLRKDIEGASLELAKSLEALKNYIDSANNPLLSDQVIVDNLKTLSSDNS